MWHNGDEEIKYLVFVCKFRKHKNHQKMSSKGWKIKSYLKRSSKDYKKKNHFWLPIFFSFEKVLIEFVLIIKKMFDDDKFKFGVH
jgi:hypothetical protein